MKLTRENAKVGMVITPKEDYRDYTDVELEMGKHYVIEELFMEEPNKHEDYCDYVGIKGLPFQLIDCFDVVELTNTNYQVRVILDSDTNKMDSYEVSIEGKTFKEAVINSVKDTFELEYKDGEFNGIEKDVKA
jgi:hypothetical protein